MFTSGATLLVRKLGADIELSSNLGQLAISAVVRQYLERVHRVNRIPIRLYPFVGARQAAGDASRPVMIDPRIQFGRPCLADTGIPTVELVERWRAGETIEALADDFEQPQALIEEAIKYGTARARAA